MGEHADAGPSGASAWLVCPAYVTLTRGKHRKGSTYAREGTAAHAVAERFLGGENVDAGETIHVEGEDIEVTDEMLEHVATYLRLADLLKQDADFFEVEARVSLDWWFSPDPMPEPVFGTADLITLHDMNSVLTVVDLKYGQGYSVSAIDNPQLRIYALGALGLLKARNPKVRFPDTIRTVIVQPRAAGPSVKTQEFTTKELLSWATTTLEPAIRRIASGDTTEVSGDHCKWCVRAGECGGLHQKALEVAKMSFGEIEPPTPQELTDEELAQVLEHAEMISSWVNRVRAEVSGRIDNGGNVPGWKLVAKRATRKWIDEDITADVLIREGLSTRDIYKPAPIRSPAQMEKILKREAIKTSLLENLITKESSGTTLVRDDDERDAVDTSAATVFDVVDH